MKTGRLFAFLLLSTSSGATWSDTTASLSLQSRIFAHKEPGKGSTDRVDVALQLSLEGQPELGESSFLSYRLRYLQTEHSSRSHGDVEVLKYVRLGSNWELSFGIDRIFWGVTESQHLVDIINQDDLLDAFHGEEKLGQPMINYNYLTRFGVLESYILLAHREKEFLPERYRLSGHLVIDNENPRYESAAAEHRLGVALRWSHSVESWDFALSYFEGTARDPMLIADDGSDHLIPFYPVIEQTGVEAQLTLDSTLWKLEAIHLDSATESYRASVLGVEYAHIGAFDTDIGLGYIAEYHFDDRRDEYLSGFQNDIFVGIRLTHNNSASTEWLGGVMHDLDNKREVARLQFETRFNSYWNFSVDAWYFSKIDEHDLGGSYDFFDAYENDSYLQASLSRFF